MEETGSWQGAGICHPYLGNLQGRLRAHTFGIKQLKGLERENLRDHMTDLELIFSMLGEAATTEIARKQDAKGFGENRVVARKGGRISGDARKKLEKETGSKVISNENYLTEPESKKRLKR